MIKEAVAWAICDTDGGRCAPMPLLRYIYPTEQVAKQAADHQGLDPAWYPVRPVRIVGSDKGDP
jgi:hypothetical protein